MKIWLKVNTRDWSGSITVARTTTKWNCLPVFLKPTRTENRMLGHVWRSVYLWQIHSVSDEFFFSISLFAYFNILERKVANLTSSLTFRLNKINWLLAGTRTSSSAEELAVVTCHIIISKEKCWTPGLLDSIKKKLWLCRPALHFPL